MMYKVKSVEVKPMWILSLFVMLTNVFLVMFKYVSCSTTFSVRKKELLGGLRPPQVILAGLGRQEVKNNLSE